MEEKQNYIRDLAEIRSMMERSSKFLSLSGWAGIMAGIYALSGAIIAYSFYNFNPDRILYSSEDGWVLTSLTNVVLLAIVILVLAVGTAILLSYKNARKRGETIWNATSRRLLANMGIPLAAGGILILIFISQNLIGLLAPLTLLFYGLALYNTSKFTYNEVKYLGLMQMCLGLTGSFFVQYGLLLWALGFGVLHIIYGIYLYFRYER